MTDSSLATANGLAATEFAQVFSERGWLAGRTPEVRTAILGAGRLVRYRPGAQIYNAGDAPDGLHGLVSGVIQIEIPGDSGETMTIHRAEPGFWIGDLAVLADQPRLVGVSARGEVCMLFVPAPKLRKLLKSRPEILMDLYALSYENMRTALRILANLSITQSHRRIALRLLHFAEDANRPEDWLEMSQEELATQTAVSLPTLQRCLKRLSEEGCVALGYGKLRVRDRDALLRFAET